MPKIRRVGDNKSNTTMENEQQIKTAAHKYAESLFDPQEINNPEVLKNSVEYHAQIFTEGANWAAEHKCVSVDKAESAAKKYAKADGNPEDMDEVVSSFMEGAEWYNIEISKRWTRKEVVVDGQKGYIIEEKPSKLRQFFSSTAGEIIIAAILGIAAAIAIFINFAE